MKVVIQGSEVAEAGEGDDLTMKDHGPQGVASRLDPRGLIIENSEPQSHKRCQLWQSSTLIKVAAGALYNAYLAYAIYYHLTASHHGDVPSEKERDWGWCDGLGFVLIITGLAYFGLFYYKVITPYVFSSRFCRVRVQHPMQTIYRKLISKLAVRLSLYGLVLASVIVFLVVDTVDDRRRLISASGVFVFVAILALFSSNPRKIRWRQVTWGLLLQFIFGLIILRWPRGRSFIDCIGAKIDRFLSFTNDGSGFVFGYLVHSQIFLPDKFANDSLAYNVTSEVNEKMAVPSVVVFRALSVIYFFSFVVNILFHFGIVQAMTVKIGWLFRISIGTTAVESMNAASNIFIGQAMAPLMIQPYLSKLTKSEIHTVMTSGFATIAGTVMAAYISFGVSPSHLLSASVMSAPAALAASKLLLPEENKDDDKESGSGSARSTPQLTDEAIRLDLHGQREVNLLDAATQGAASAATFVLNITAIVIAFIAFVSFLNALVSFFGGLVGQHHITFEWILGYAFMPFAFIMGVEWSECNVVGTLIGIKTVANEFIAYRRLGVLIEAGALSPRSTTIATYALCGYANPGSVGVQLATLTSLCPERRGDFVATVGRAFVAGTIACFLTACIAGALL